MALVEAASLMFSAAVEIVSLIWMELAMFAVAAIVYMFCIGGSPATFLGSLTSAKKIDDDDHVSSEAPKGKASKADRRKPSPRSNEPLAHEDRDAVSKCWQRLRSSENPPPAELHSVVNSMQRLGSSPLDIVAELRSTVDCKPQLLKTTSSLPTALLRDDAVELLAGVVKLLEEHKEPVDLAVYAGLMSGQLRRRDFAGVAATAQKIAPEALTPKMRGVLTMSAAHRGRLDEALGHIRQFPVGAAGSQCALSPSSVKQVLALALREQRASAAAHELQRIGARLESKDLDELLVAENKRGGAVACQELMEVSAIMKVPKGQRVYEILASTLMASGQGEEFRSLIDELESESARGSTSLAVGEPLALKLLEVAKSLRDGDAVPRVVELHRLACAGAPGARVLSAACVCLIACDRNDAACDFYEHQMLPKSIWPDAALTSSLLKVAAQVDRHSLTQRLSEHAGSMRPSASGCVSGARDELQRHAAIMKAHARQRDLASAARVFNDLRASGMSLTSMIYNCYLDCCVQCGDLDGALAHFREMKQLNYVDVVGYNTVLKAYLARGLTQEARALVKEMASRGHQANKVTYNELLHATVLAKDRRGVWSLMDEMSASGVQANSVTCSILLKSLTEQSHPADVKRVIGLIDEVEGTIDEVLFSSVIEACIRIKQLDLLSDLMRRYRRKGGFVNLTAPTYGSMIKAYGQVGDIVRVRELWQEMEERGVKPTSITFGCMTEALVRNSQADEAWELIHTQSESDENKACVNTVIYSTVLKGFAVSRRIDKVFAVYQEMRSKNIPCNTITYNTMLDAFAKCCTMNKVPQILEDMLESSVEPDIITYSTIVKGYCAEGDLDRAFQVLEDMRGDDKLAPDEIMYNSILDGCSKQHRVDDALRVLEDMKTAGIVPSNYTLSILVKLLGHARRLSQAFRMVEELSQQHGFRPNVQVYTCLVQACLLNRRLERAMALHDTMVADAGCKVDEKFYAVLARGCLQLQQPMKAIDVVRAAYRLPGHSLAEPARKDARPVGVEARALDEIAARLYAGGQDERDAVAKLCADLLEQRGVHLSESNNGGSGGRGGQRGRRGGATRNWK